MRLACVFLAVSLLACRDVEIVDGAGGGGSSTTTSSKGSTTVVGSSSSGVSKICGGKTGAQCAPDEYCDFADDSCGIADGTGVCTPKPPGCFTDCPGVCGCDGALHCSACEAAQLGVDVSSSTACFEEDAYYTAEIWMGGLDHLVIRKADFDQDICLEIFLDAPSMVQDPYLVTAPQQFAASNAIAIQGAIHCEQDVGPSPLVYQAVTAKGAVTWTVEPNMFYPCVLDVDVTLEFESSSSSLFPTQKMQSTGVKVDGGCI